MQERTALPPTSTVQAPQTPIPQPYLAPFRSSTSRRTHRSGVSDGTSTVRRTLFTFSFSGIGDTSSGAWHKSTPRKHFAGKSICRHAADEVTAVTDVGTRDVGTREWGPRAGTGTAIDEGA